MNLLLIEPGDLCGNRATLVGAQARHVRDVLGVKAGDTVRVGVLEGPTGLATVETVAADTVGLVCALTDPVPPRPRVDLLLALPRPKVLKRLWAQLASLGVGRILLVNAAKVERSYFDTHVLDEAFYRPLLVEGLQQARDTRLPVVSVHRRFRPLVEDELDGHSDATLRLVADPSGTVGLHEAAAGHATERALLAVGPEGGWTPFELELLAKRGFAAVGLGPRILRTDTACLALLALLHDALSRGCTTFS